MHRNLIFIGICILLSCSKIKSNKYDFIDKVDAIKIFYNVTDSSFKPVTIALDKRHRDFFKDVLASEAEKSNCQPNETIKFYSKNIEIFSVETAINSEKGCQFLIVKNNEENEYHRLTYNLGMFLSQ